MATTAAAAAAAAVTVLLKPNDMCVEYNVTKYTYQQQLRVAVSLILRRRVQWMHSQLLAFRLISALRHSAANIFGHHASRRPSQAAGRAPLYYYDL